MDPLVAIAFAAAVTRAIRLGTGITLVVQRDPIYLAKGLRELRWLQWPLLADVD